MTEALPAGVPAPVRRHRRAVRPVGRRPPHRRPAVPRHRPCARPSAPSRAGPRCPTWTTTRASCTPSRSPRRWRYLMLRPLLDDVPDDDMCGVTANQVFPASEQWHAAAARGALRHPRRQGRRLRLVALRHDPLRRPGHGPEGLGQRHVHPRRPVVPAQRGVRRSSVREAFLTGSSPSDFPDEHYERAWDQPVHGRRAQRHRTPRPRPRLSDPGRVTEDGSPGPGRSGRPVSRDGDRG